MPNGAELVVCIHEVEDAAQKAAAGATPNTGVISFDQEASFNQFRGLMKCQLPGNSTESYGPNLALAVLFVPYSLDSGD